MESTQTEIEPPKSSQGSDNKKVKTSLWTKLSFLVCFSVSAGIVVAGYHYYSLQQIKELEWQQQLKAIQQTLKQQASMTEQFRAENQQVQKKNQKLQQQLAELETNVTGLAKRSPKHWMAAEADYLVRMAGRKLWLENDPTTAAELLKAADQQVAAMQDPSLLPLRKAIAGDLTKVKSVTETDVSGAVFAIDGVIEQLANLPLNQLKPSNEQPAEDNTLSDSIYDWRSNLSKTWHALLKDFIHIRKRQGDVTPLISPKQRWYLEENIKNKLLQAQLSLYRNDEINFHHSIKLAHQWLAEYFDLQDERTQNALNELEQLQKLSIFTNSLSRFDSLPLLKQLVTYGHLFTTKESTL